MRIHVRSADRDDKPDTGLLVRVAFDPDPSHGGGGEPVVHTGLRPLVGTAAAEDWVSSTPVARGHDGAFHYAHNGEICFGWLYLDLAGSLEAATRAAYEDMFRVFGGLGFAHLLRAWHYLPDIHAREAGVSRYRHFCRGRFAAFEASPKRSYCAATVIGTHAASGVMYFLASRTSGTMVENPRQVSAWRYPLSAARERPLFARAVCKAWEGRTHFYVSGTAGIVGHESRHPGDPAAQLREALLNLRALIDEMPDFSASQHLTSLKIYVARADYVDTVRKLLAASEFTAESVALFEGEICRPELCVEIEALVV